MTSAVGQIDLRNRLALSIAEAAQVVGLSENAFRAVLPEIERVYVGRRILIPVKALEEWLTEQAKTPHSRDQEIVAEVLKAVR